MNTPAPTASVSTRIQGAGLRRPDIRRRPYGAAVASVYLLRCADGTLYCGWTVDLGPAPRRAQRGYRQPLHARAAAGGARLVARAARPGRRHARGGAGQAPHACPEARAARRPPGIGCPACCARSRATRYVTPLREGGSLPALVEADDDGLYVAEVPRRRAGAEGARRGGDRRRAGARARVAGAGARARRARPGARAHRARPGDPGPARGERRPQPRPRLPARRARLRPGVPRRTSTPSSPAAIVWLDALVTQRGPHAAQSRTCWSGTAALWLIDHGAALYFITTRRADITAARRRALPAIARARAAARTPPRSPRPTRAWRRASTPGC